MQASEYLLARPAVASSSGASSSAAAAAAALNPSQFASSKLFHQFSDMATQSTPIPFPAPVPVAAKPEPQERPMESTSVYVSNLPRDISEEEIGIPLSRFHAFLGRPPSCSLQIYCSIRRGK